MSDLSGHPKPANDKARDIDSDERAYSLRQHEQYLSKEKKQQVIALGKLGWPLRRIEQGPGVRRETAGAYLKAARIAVRPPGAWGRRAPAKPANGVTTDFSRSISLPTSNRDRVSSACEPYRELIEQGLGRGRNAMAIWQDLISDHGFPGGHKTVKRFVQNFASCAVISSAALS